MPSRLRVLVTETVATILVLAGTNGCGKSSIAGARLRAAGANYFNPDEATEELLAETPGLSLEDARASVWKQGRDGLESAISKHESFAFETTLGGRTMTRLLHEAIDAGLRVRMWYAGMESPELHIARVAQRVAKGGHDIPADRIRERYSSSLLNLASLVPRLWELRLYDNSEEHDPALGEAPRPRLLLHLKNGHIEYPRLDEMAATPEWAKPIVAQALEATRNSSE